jgi:hypothetical protein
MVVVFESSTRAPWDNADKLLGGRRFAGCLERRGIAAEPRMNNHVARLQDKSFLPSLLYSLIHLVVYAANCTFSVLVICDVTLPGLKSLVDECLRRYIFALFYDERLTSPPHCASLTIILHISPTTKTIQVPSKFNPSRLLGRRPDSAPH